MVWSTSRLNLFETTKKPMKKKDETTLPLWHGALLSELRNKKNNEKQCRKDADWATSSLSRLSCRPVWYNAFFRYNFQRTKSFKNPIMATASARSLFQIARFFLSFLFFGFCRHHGFFFGWCNTNVRCPEKWKRMTTATKALWRRSEKREMKRTYRWIRFVSVDDLVGIVSKL